MPRLSLTFFSESISVLKQERAESGGSADSGGCRVDVGWTFRRLRRYSRSHSRRLSAAESGGCRVEFWEFSNLSTAAQSASPVTPAAINSRNADAIMPKRPSGGWARRLGRRTERLPVYVPGDQPDAPFLFEERSRRKRLAFEDDAAPVGRLAPNDVNFVRATIVGNHAGPLEPIHQALEAVVAIRSTASFAVQDHRYVKRAKTLRAFLRELLVIGNVGRSFPRFVFA